MNRRDFVKALAGIPLLGLLVKVPEAEEELFEAAYAELEQNAKAQPPYELSVGTADDAGTGVADYCYIGDREPYHLPWDGREWADILTRWSNDIVNAAAQKVDDQIMNG